MTDTSKEAMQKLSMDCKLVADVLHDAGSFETGQAILLGARNALEALTAELDEAKRELDEARAGNKRMREDAQLFKALYQALKGQTDAE